MLSGGYSLVHTSVGFDTEMFTPESKEDLGQRDKIVDDLGNIVASPMKKVKKKSLCRI